MAELFLLLLQFFLLSVFQCQAVQFFHLVAQQLQAGLCLIGILLAFGQPLAGFVPGLPGVPGLFSQLFCVGKFVQQFAVGLLA